MPHNTISTALPWDALTREFAVEDRTLPVMLQAQALRFGDRVLYEFHGKRVTYSEAISIASRGAQTLHLAGVSKGDRVALVCGNRPEFFEVFLGAAWLGAITVPLNTAIRGTQLQHMLENSGAELLVAEATFLSRLELIDQSRIQLTAVLSIGEKEEEPDLLINSTRSATWQLASSAAPRPLLAPSDPLAILYTSGTTGVSKGVICAHAQYFWWAFHNANILEIVQGDKLLTTLPLFHTNALSTFFQALLTGSSIFVETKFSASGFLRSIQNSGATVTYLLGAMVPILLSTPKTENDNDHGLRVILAPGVPAEAASEFEERFGTVLLDGFASTESNFVIGSPQSERKRGTMGKLRPGFEARIVDELDVEVSIGTPGELLLRASDSFAFATGYFGMPDKTVESWRNLWLHTGDRVIQDVDGYFRFMDRIKDVIRRRGENISSYEVEQAIGTHPAVKNVAVYPVKSELAEDEVMASVILHDNATLTPLELMDHCQPLIAYFAVPRFIDFVNTLPTTENGKIRKFKLRETGITPNTWDREHSGYVLVR